ncbi:MAG: hypothetical protein KTR32_15245, partial [Granulosicoccus sp.]|nr:hypothetical protein [Granulosicoccus sp.]
MPEYAGWIALGTRCSIIIFALFLAGCSQRWGKNTHRCDYLGHLPSTAFQYIPLHFTGIVLDA